MQRYAIFTRLRGKNDFLVVLHTKSLFKHSHFVGLRNLNSPIYCACLSIISPHGKKGILTPLRSARNQAKSSNLESPKMAEDLGKKIEVVLTRLKTLDNIENPLMVTCPLKVKKLQSGEEGQGRTATKCGLQRGRHFCCENEHEEKRS